MHDRKIYEVNLLHCREKALSLTGNKGVEPAMEWLLSHPEENFEIKAPEKQEEEKNSEVEKQDAKSIKCNE